MEDDIPLKIFVEKSKLVEGKWDPYYYRGLQTQKKLSNYVIVRKVQSRPIPLVFRPIRYADVPVGDSLIFVLERVEPQSKTSAKLPSVEEQTLLFGTMRAYLANVIVTPRADWIGMRNPLYFPVHSEFLEVIPNDGLAYFWWAYFHTKAFLDNLPKGHGGTRPRMKIEAFASTPISVPELKKREEINSKLCCLAEQEWRNYMQKNNVLRSLNVLA